MTKEEIREDTLRLIIRKIDELLNVKIESLKREGKEFNFIHINGMIHESFDNIKNLKENIEYVGLLSSNRLNNIKNNLSEFVEIVIQIKGFDAKKIANPQEAVDNITNNFEKCYDNLHTNLFNDLDIFIHKKERNQSSIHEQHEEFKLILKSMTEDKKKADKTLSALQKAAGVTGATKFRNIYDLEVKDYKLRATTWLIIAIISAGLIFFYINNIFSDLTDAMSTATENGGTLSLNASIQVYFTKLLILSFLSYIFYQVIKNYNANMHLQTLNRHRGNCMMTFQAFVNSTEDKDAQRTILIEATKAIFESGDTGYISSKEMGSSSGEIIKIVTDGIRGKSSS